MDLTPYLKLMVEKKGEELKLEAGSPVQVKMGKQYKPVGKNTLTGEMTKAAAFGLMSDDQKKQFAKSKALQLDTSNAHGHFNVDVSVKKKAVCLAITIKAEEEKEEAKPEAEPEEDNSLIDSTNLLDYLRLMIERDGSDLFLTSGSKIKAKISGSAVPLSTFVADADITRKCAYSIMTDEQIEKFEKTKDLDFAIAMPDNSGRFRANAFFQRRTIGMVMRLIPSEIPNAKAFGLPEVLLDLIMAKRGLLLMVGGTGSGKSTTLAAMLDHRNASSPGHILTIEDPVEFSHPNKMSIVNQREVGVDTASYAAAIKASLREAPDVILIGEIRTEETMEAALELANTGHLCISTMHANTANQALDRCINMFPTEKHKQLFMDMSANITAVISQRLIPDVRGKRCAAIEILINTPHIASLILKGQLSDIKEAMQSSGTKGMKTFDDALYDLYKAGKISMEEALKNADSRNDLEGKINFG
ncbi:PilT/PilU family type 4a pilus ATPase [Candidatus Albibeggiatoa sp. nov. NOAA]|uniref:PilT/PilU family type 4a pilus ATPase n=1 Tax=Candidatus Albibeggiatoa sp. nov. NOAA TaxID=3162724 RepID=UPI0032FDDBFC|nr:PilT/PilU family type 4a pilus ATPase [Thiotrichaceae bacterium]